MQKDLRWSEFVNIIMDCIVHCPAWRGQRPSSFSVKIYNCWRHFRCYTEYSNCKGRIWYISPAFGFFRSLRQQQFTTWMHRVIKLLGNSRNTIIIQFVSTAIPTTQVELKWAPELLLLLLLGMYYIVYIYWQSYYIVWIIHKSWYAELCQSSFTKYDGMAAVCCEIFADRIWR